MVRNAKTSDIAALVALGQSMHNSTNFSNCTYDAAKVAELMECLIGAEQGIVLVAEVDGQVVGGLVGAVLPQWFGPDLQASDYAFFIHPDHRGMLAFRLAAAFTKRAGELGAKRICLGNSTGYELERTKRLYERSGYELVGYNFVYSR